MLARDSESRHAVGAENEIPDIAEYSGGEAGFFQIWARRGQEVPGPGPRVLHRQDRRPAAGDHQQARPRRPPGPGGRRRDHRPRSCRSPGAARERSPGAARPRPRAERGPPAPRRAGGAPGGPRRAPGGRGGTVPGPGQGPLSAAAAGLALGMSKSAAHRHLAALRQAGVVEKAAAAAGQPGGSSPARTRRHPAGQYTTIAAPRPGRARRPGRRRRRAAGRSWSRSGRSPTGRA